MQKCLHPEEDTQQKNNKLYFLVSIFLYDVHQSNVHSTVVHINTYSCLRHIGTYFFLHSLSSQAFRLNIKNSYVVVLVLKLSWMLNYPNKSICQIKSKRTLFISSFSSFCVGTHMSHLSGTEIQLKWIFGCLSNGARWSMQTMRIICLAKWIRIWLMVMVLLDSSSISLLIGER